VAIDLTLPPYHGEPAREEAEIRRGPAKSGTTHFHGYATAYLIRKNKRLTLAMTSVRAREPLSAVLERLLAELDRLGISRTRLYLDRQFFTVEVIGYFQQRRAEERVVMPVVVRGKNGGTRALLKGRRSHWTQYTMRNTMRSREHGSATFRVAVVCKHSKGRYGRHGVQHFAYAVLGEIPGKPQRLYAEYRQRFGIESSYRLMNELRIRTSSRCPKLRLLFVAAAFLLANRWVYLKWSRVSERRRGGRRVQHAHFRLRLFRHFLREAVRALYGAVLSIPLPRMHPQEPSFLNY
jgi:IS4 transposase